MALLLLLLFVAGASAVDKKMCFSNPGGSSVCIWTAIHNREDVTYEKAVEICAKGNSVPLPYFPTELSYEMTVEDIRSKIEPQNYLTLVWTATQMDPVTGTVTNPSHFDELITWGPYPMFWKQEGAHDTQVYLSVARQADYFYQGLWNSDPSVAHNGVICMVNK